MFASRTEWDLRKNRYTQALDELRAGGHDLLDLTVSNPTACGMRYDGPAILGVFQDPRSLHYDPTPKGLLSARQSVAAYYLEKGATVLPEDILLTTSTSEAYSFLFRLLCAPGDEVLVPRPGYPLFDFLAQIQDVRLRPYALVYDHGWQIDFHSLESAISERTRAVLLVHPNNPTGSFVSQSEQTRLSSICARHDLAIVSDEVFHDFAFIQHPAASLAANTGALTFTLSGLSKISGLPQMKAAWCVVSGPPQLKQQALARLEVIADTYLSVNTPIQIALPTLLGWRRSFQPELRQRLSDNLAELDRQLAGQETCRHLVVDGGWYATLRVPVTGTDEDLAIDLMREEGVIVHPGHFFDFESEGFLVLSLMTPQQDFGEGVRRILSRFQKLQK